MSSLLMDYPFADRLRLAAGDVPRQRGGRGWDVILRDGNMVFEPQRV
jgi:hypothetical protein